MCSRSVAMRFKAVLSSTTTAGICGGGEHVCHLQQKGCEHLGAQTHSSAPGSVVQDRRCKQTA